jgi:hypothetical protein
MSAGIRDWLAGLSASDPRTSAAVVHALTALADEGPDLGAPMVVALDEPPGADPSEELDYAYQERLERMQHLRRTTANADELTPGWCSTLDGWQARRRAATLPWQRGSPSTSMPRVTPARCWFTRGSGSGRSSVSSFRRNEVPRP